MTEPNKQVSEVPLEALQPKPRGQNLLLLFLLGCFAAVVTGLTLFWLESNKPEPDPHVTKWPREIPPDHREEHGDYDGAIARMQLLADALNRYREGPQGGGVRWPHSLEELQMAGLLEPDWSNIGLLSGKPLMYQPEMPIGHDPERWVICHDTEFGRRRNNQGFSVLGPVAAAVILGDGSVKLIEGGDMQTYGGLNTGVEAGR